MNGYSQLVLMNNLKIFLAFIFHKLLKINKPKVKLKTEIKVLKADHGDSIFIKTFDINGSVFNILVDGGTVETFATSLKTELKKIDKINLLVLTHIDSDHIGGINKFVKSDMFDKIEIEKFWINCPNLIRIARGGKVSYSQGKTLEEILISKKIPKEKWQDKIVSTNQYDFCGIKFQILSPPPEILDELFKKWPTISAEQESSLANRKITNSQTFSTKSLVELAKEKFNPNKTVKGDIFNSSSIAIILRTLDCSILLLGDSRPEIILKSLQDLGYNNIDNKLKVDYVKVSHHGSKNNTSCEVLDLIECDKFLISTNGGNSKHKHPNRETIARIIFHPKRDFSRKRHIYFNYPIKKIFEKSGKIFGDKDFESGNWEIHELQ